MSAQIEDYYSPDTFNRIKALADTQETPFLVVDTGMVDEAYNDLTQKFPTAKIYYAVKANPAPEIINLLKDKGSNFDIASIYELDRVLEHGGHRTA